MQPTNIEPLFRKVSAIINSFVIPTKAFQLFRFLTIFIRSPSTTTAFFLLLNLRNLQTVRMLNLKYMLFSKSIGQEQIRPILLSLIHQYELGHLSQEKYEETLLFLYDFFICYTIIGQENSNKITNAIYKNSSILENHYSDSALECFISELKNKLPSKEVFLKAFSNLGWSHHAGYYDDDRNKERVQVVLEVLERYKCASKQCAAFTIEHILDDTNSPENGIIGNLIPLEDSLNSRCNGKDFASKLKIYETSMFQTRTEYRSAICWKVHDRYK